MNLGLLDLSKKVILEKPYFQKKKRITKTYFFKKGQVDQHSF